MTRKRRLGVLGTLVWDVIHGRAPARAPVAEWGGIAYSLGAFDAALGPDWELVPVIKVGRDLIVQAREFMNGLGRVAPGAALIEVPYPNNRVTLTYHSSERRSEVLSGGVPPWSWLGLKPLLSDLDALYVNLISGFELDLGVAQLLRQHFGGPIYCDLHSLLLAVQPDGLRIPRPIEGAADWCGCFDLVQVNEDEMLLLADDPMQLASTALSAGVRCLVVTLGRRGVVYFTASDFRDAPVLRRGRSLGPDTGTVSTALVPGEPARESADGDPTGCGDVWGATYFSRLLAGDSFAGAVHAAMLAAARNVEHHGATGLSEFLRGGLAVK